MPRDLYETGARPADSPENRDGLLDRFLDGDPEADSLIRSWVSEVVRVNRWRINDREAVIQEVMIRLLILGREGRFRAESSLKTFTRAVAKNTCIDAHRRGLLISRTEAALETETKEPASVENPESERQRRERIEHLFRVLERLSSECRKLWHWVYQQGLPSRRIAELLGTTEVAVRARVYRCLKQARRIAGETPGGTA